jgi:O-antigen ligase
VADHRFVRFSTKLTPILLVSCTPLLAFIAFSGIASFYWVIEPYDGWRIFQIASMVLLAIYAVFIPIDQTSLSKNASHLMKAALPLLIGIVAISISQAEYPARAAADAALYGLVATSIWVQAKIFKQHPPFAPNIAALLAILPLLTLIFLPMSLVAHVLSSTKHEWHGLFSNIRMLDDAVLPCLFLLWQRPAWLAHGVYQRLVLNRLMTICIFTVSVIYLLAFFYDGGRAVIFSTLIGLVFVILFRTDLWSRLKLPLLSTLSAGFIFTVLETVFPDFLARPMLRTSSSGREELWLKALALWREQPLFGVGGNHFVTSNPWMLNGHPHNILLQFLSEYGIAAFLVILILMPTSIQIFKHRKTLPAFAIAAVIAVLVNAFFSGALVYPLSLTLGLWPIAWLVSLLATYSLNPDYSRPKPLSPHRENSHAITSNSIISNLIISNSIIKYTSWHSSFKFMTMLAIVAMLFVHHRDMMCIGCTSVDSYNAPRFWQYGRALHLEYETKPLKSL